MANNVENEEVNKSLKLGETDYYTGELYIHENEKIESIKLHIPNEEERKKPKFIYDNNSGNAHFFSDDVKKAIECSTQIKEKRKKVRAYLKKEETRINNILDDSKWPTKIKVTRKGGTASFANGTDYGEAQGIFYYIGVECETRNYDLIFIRFYKNDNKKTVNCILNSIQFEMYERKLLSINIYPESRDNGVYTPQNDISKGYYYNAPISFYDSVETIGNEFLKFIKLNEKRILDSDKSFIIFKAVVADADAHLLKLNRETQKLEVYRKVSNEKIREYYSIRENFDSSNHVIFEIENIFDCIFGSEKRPTPNGLFKIQNKSSGEFISEYHPEYDKVKFFGYLVVFEDYYIHSDMYTVNVTKDMIKKYNNVESISKGDEFTSGCIRVSQEDADWLVENIEIGTTVIL